MKLTIVGMDFVGLVNAVGFAEKGHQVFGLDSDKKKIAQLRKNEISLNNEYKLSDILQKNDVNIRFTSEYRDAIYDANVIMFCVEPVEKENGRIDLSPLYLCAKECCRFINHDVTVIIRTTVPVGTNRELKEFMMAITDKKYNIDVVSNPEFLSQGSAVKDMLSPSRIVVGVSTRKAQQVMKELYQGFESPLLFVSPESAELIKYASNSYLAVKLSYINEIADLCDKVGADIQEVSFGIGLDPRIGTKYLSSGVGFGGPALTLDTKVLQQLADEKKVQLSILDAAVKVNNNRSDALIEKIKSVIGTISGHRFAVLGLSYKGNTDDIRKSPAFNFIEALLKEEGRIIAYDTNSTLAFKKKMKSDQHLDYANSLEEALRTCDYAVFLNESEEFKKLTNDQIVEYMKNPVVFDGKAVLNPYQLPDVKYYAIGKRIKSK
ncbi:MAG: UDP-glucose/GDP-mannose dehydrogenase family protein [Bacilli bacterium]|nr:UDP-glucose/GDP-mannose dehydrogenase family protein [Bacillales bacterium]MDY2575646.1 UDP-glucose/GDP-mannose dehydrogenase family protein [Bacilli bacterium]